MLDLESEKQNIRKTLDRIKGEIQRVSEELVERTEVWSKIQKIESENKELGSGVSDLQKEMAFLLDRDLFLKSQKHESVSVRKLNAIVDSLKAKDEAQKQGEEGEAGAAADNILSEEDKTKMNADDGDGEGEKKS